MKRIENIIRQITKSTDRSKRIKGVTKCYPLQKTQINLFFYSLIRTLDWRSKVLSLENEKKSKLSFCILLAYSYLCRQEKTKACK